MRRLGVEYGIYVPEKYVGTGQFKVMTHNIASAAGGYTETFADGTWVDPKGDAKNERVHIITTRATEFEYSEYTRVNRAMHEFGKWMIGQGEKEVMRYKGDKFFMQHAVDKE